MSERELNSHEQAVVELEKWEEQGVRHMFDPTVVVMGDLYRKEVKE